MKEEILIDIQIPDKDNEEKIDNLTSSIGALVKKNSDLIDQNKQLAKTGQENSKQYLENARQIEINKQKINENTASRKGLIQTIIAEDNSIKGLQVRNAELIKQRNLINTGTEEGRKRIATINAELDKNNKVIRENSSALEKQKINIGNYASALDNAIPGLGGFVTGLTNMINPLTASAAGLGALISLYKQSTIGTKDLEFASNQLSAALNMAGNSLANLISSAKDGEGIFSKLTNAIIFSVSPTIAALSKLQAGLREEQEDLNREAKRALAEQQELLADNAELLQEAAVEGTSLNDKLYLTTQAITNIRDAADNVLKIRQEELANLESQLSLDKENESLQDAILDKKLQIAQEEKRSERLINNILKQEDNMRAQEEKRIENLQKQNEKLEEQEAILLRHLEFKPNPEEEVTLQETIDNALLAQKDAYNAELIAKMDATAKKGVQITTDKNKAEQKADKATTDIHKLQEESKLAATSAGLGAAKSAFKEHTIAYKVLAIAQATIDTYRAANAALSFVNPIVGGIFAALAIIAGLANVAKIAGVQFAKGGLLLAKQFAFGGIAQTGGVLSGASHARGGIPFSVGGRPGFEAEGGEAIINKRSTAMYRKELSAINQAGGGVAFATGGVVANETRIATDQARSQFDANQMADLINKVQTVLVLQDFEAKQNETNQTAQRAVVIE